MRQVRLERVRKARQVALHQLALQRERGGGDDHRGVVGLRVAHRGHEVGEGLAGTCAGLHREVALRVQCARHGLSHALLPLARCTPKLIDDSA